MIANKRICIARIVMTTCVGSWYAMMAAHEFGHVVGAWLSGGRVERIVLEFFSFSRTDVSPNPHPLIVVWAGPIVGSLLPLLAWATNRLINKTSDLIARFWAAFCLLANGLYIGAGSFGRIGDAGDMLAAGSPMWMLVTFGIITAAAGLALFNGLGPRFGFGPNGRISPRDLAAATVFCAVSLIIVAAL